MGRCDASMVAQVYLALAGLLGSGASSAQAALAQADEQLAAVAPDSAKAKVLPPWEELGGHGAGSCARMQDASWVARQQLQAGMQCSAILCTQAKGDVPAWQAAGKGRLGLSMTSKGSGLLPTPSPSLRAELPAQTATLAAGQ